MNNNEKKKQYAILMSQLKKATYNEFYYEAIFIEYAIFEDRTESILRHANIPYENSKGYSLKLNEKLNKIKSRKEFNNKYIKKHIPNDFIEEIYSWKEKRDKLIHALVKNEYDYDTLKTIALHGECLANKLANKSKLVNKHLDNNFEKGKKK